jgi:hypothetical protein
MLDNIAAILFYGIFATPFIAYFIVRKRAMTRADKGILFFLITAILAGLFFFIAIKIHFRNGLA